MLIFYDSSVLMGGGNDVVIFLFMLVFKNVGFVFVVLFMNVVILILVLLVGNLGMYVLIWMLYLMSKDKLVFEIFGKINKNGVLYMFLLVIVIIVVIIFVV